MGLKECILTNNKQIIEDEVERLIQAPLPEVSELLNYDETKIYFLMIMEKRIKIAKQMNQPLQPLLMLIQGLRFENDVLNNRLAHLWGLFALFEWPEISIDFFSDWFCMLIFEKLLFLTLYGTDIDQHRRQELIAAFGDVDLEKVYCALDTHPGIAMRVLKHISVFRHVDYRRIASQGFTGEDFDDIIYNMMSTEKGVLTFLTTRKPSSRIISRLKTGECVEYALRGLKYPESFEAAVYYLRKHPNILNEPQALFNNLFILCKAYPSQEDYLQPEIKSVISEYTKRYPEICSALLTSCYCKEISALLIKNCNNRTEIQSSDPYVCCYKAYMLGDKLGCLNYLSGADERLLLLILDRFSFTTDELNLFRTNSEEVQVKLELKMNLGTRWNGNVKRYYYILKNNIFDDIQMFYQYYLAGCSYDYIYPTFGVLFKNTTVPDPVLRKLYDDLDTVQVQFFKEFVIEALPHIPHANVFVEKIHQRMINEWYTDEDMVLVLKKYLDILNKLNDVPKIIDMIQIDHVQVLRKALNILSTKEYQPDMLIPRLVEAYRSPYVIDLQPNIVSLLLKAIMKSSNSELEEIKNRISGESPSRQKHILKEYLKDLKGKPLNMLYSGPKVTAKGVFRKSNVEKKTQDEQSIANFLDKRKSDKLCMEFKDVDNDVLNAIEEEIKSLRKKNSELYDTLLQRNNNLNLIGQRADILKLKSSQLYKTAGQCKKRTVMVSIYTIAIFIFFLIFSFLILK